MIFDEGILQAGNAALGQKGHRKQKRVADVELRQDSIEDFALLFLIIGQDFRYIALVGFDGIVDKAFAQALFERVVQLVAGKPLFAQVEEMVHHRFVHLDHLVDDLLVPVGDRAEVAERVTEGLGLDGIRSGLTPDEKVLLVLTEHKNGPVMMVGDGINDAPALAAADVGVAMGARGAAASAEAADVVLLVDRVDRIAPGIEIARRSRRIALESVVAGIGLSVLGMIAAAFGYLTPVQGALLQEAIDVAVILNALRALRTSPAGITASQIRIEGVPA